MKTFQILLITAFSMIILSCGSKKSNSTATDVSTLSENVAQAQATQSATVKKYPVKSGIITFDNDLMGIKRKSILYFDDYGMKEADEKYDGDNIKEINLCDGKMRYNIIMKDKAAYEAGNCYRGIAYKFDWDEISKADKKYKVNKLANREVAGKDCESYSLESGNFPTIFAGWNNILLYQETKSQYGTAVVKAVKVETDIDVPAEKFKIPEGFDIKKGI